MSINPMSTRRENVSQAKTSKIPPKLSILREILRKLPLFFCLNFLNPQPPFHIFHCLPKKEEGDDDDDDEENLCHKKATFKGKIFHRRFRWPSQS